MYDTVAVECKKLDEYSIRPNAKLAAVAHICGQLLPYAQVKSEMIDLYPLQCLTTVMHISVSFMLFLVKIQAKTF